MSNYHVKYLSKAIASYIAALAVLASGAIHPILGLVLIVVFVCTVVPYMWRQTTIYNTDRMIQRKRQNIETQIMQGQFDGRLMRDTAAQMRRDGRL